MPCLDGTGILRISVIHPPSADEPFVVLDKPSGLPSAPLFDGDESAYTQAALLYPQLRCVMGRKLVEHGLVHRIDTDTSGLLLIAASQEFYDHIVSAQQQGLFIKTYAASCSPAAPAEGFPPPPVRPRDLMELGRGACVSSWFRPFGLHNMAVRPVTEASGRAARRKASSAPYWTDIVCAGTAETGGRTVCRMRCTVRRGYRHQVRCHLAWCGLPIIGDRLYNPHAGEEKMKKLCFAATELCFPLEGRRSLSGPFVIKRSEKIGETP